MANNPNLSATNVIRLNHTHLFLNLQQNFSFPFCTLQISSKLSKIRSNSPTYSANYTKFAPFANILYIMFQMPDQWQRTP